MNTKISKSWLVVCGLFVLLLVSGCSDSGKKESPATGTNAIQSSGTELPGAHAPEVSAESAASGDIAVSVDGVVMKKADLEKELQAAFNMYKNKIPADKQKEMKEQLRKQLIQVFIMKTLLSREVKKRKITASNEEITKTIETIKTQMAPNKTADEFMKENKIKREDVALAVKIEKFRDMEVGQKGKPTDKEISKFYNENREKLFIQPASVHVRHILVAVKKEDDEKTKEQKKAKIEDIRKQLLSGGDFAELARKNSDCPSKEMGGDLSYIKKGQMVKEFETAAFSQEKNAIGPVIKTQYGYHIVQVLDKKPEKKVELNEVKAKIATHLEQTKKMEAFNAIVKKIREQAKVVIY